MPLSLQSRPWKPLREDGAERAVEAAVVPAVEGNDAIAVEGKGVPEPAEPGDTSAVAAAANETNGPTTSAESTSRKEVKNVNANVHPMFTKDPKKAKTVAEGQAKDKAAPKIQNLCKLCKPSSFRLNEFNRIFKIDILV